jgi:arylsulfatase A-like enzyme
MPEWSSNPLVRRWDELSEEEKRRNARSMATYAAMMESQDANIGRIMNYLRESDELANTLVIYISDNGPEGQNIRGPLSHEKLAAWLEAVSNPSIESIGDGDNYAFLGTELANATTGGYSWWKWFIGEGGVRVPLIIVPPADTRFTRKGTKTDVFVSVKDVPVTILDYAGIQHPGDTYKGRTIVLPSGVSIRPFLEGKTNEVRSDAQWYAFELFGNGYIVAGDYRASKFERECGVMVSGTYTISLAIPVKRLVSRPTCQKNSIS